jgi:hypothetical protein
VYIAKPKSSRHCVASRQGEPHRNLRGQPTSVPSSSPRVNAPGRPCPLVIADSPAGVELVGDKWCATASPAAATCTIRRERWPAPTSATNTRSGPPPWATRFAALRQLHNNRDLDPSVRAGEQAWSPRCMGGAPGGYRPGPLPLPPGWKDWTQRRRRAAGVLTRRCRQERGCAAGPATRVCRGCGPGVGEHPSVQSGQGSGQQA